MGSTSRASADLRDHPPTIFLYLKRSKSALSSGMFDVSKGLMKACALKECLFNADKMISRKNAGVGGWAIKKTGGG